MNNVLYEKKIEIYLDLIQHILTFFRSKEFVSLPVPLLKMEIHKKIAKAILVSNIELEEKFIKYMDMIFMYVESESNQDSEKLHNDIKQYVLELYDEIKKDIFDENESPHC